MSDVDAEQDFGEEDTLVLEQRFAIVPEWIIDADIGDRGYRLYSVLLRYAQTFRAANTTTYTRKVEHVPLPAYAANDAAPLISPIAAPHSSSRSGLKSFGHPSAYGHPLTWR